jgi:hypothetical protein
VSCYCRLINTGFGLSRIVEKEKSIAPGCEFRMWLGSATADLPDQLKLNQRAALKATLATPATCTRSAGKSSASPRRNIPGRSGRGTRACSIFGKGCVWIGCSCLRSASCSVFACGKKGRYAEHDQSCRPPRLFSHEAQIHTRIGDVNRDLAKQSKYFTARHTVRCR